MIFKFGKIRQLSQSDKTLVFYMLLLMLSFTLLLLASFLNENLGKLLSDYSIVMSGVSVPNVAVLIAPIVEECIKLFGYSVLFLLPLEFRSWMGENHKDAFINNNIAIAFIISAGGFGFFEGFLHNAGFNRLCFISFISLNVFAHMTYSIYPFVLGRRYRNRFFVFLPIAMLIHAVHNFILKMAWDNKWVTFAIVMVFLVPLLILERKNMVELANRLFPEISWKYILVAFIILFVYIFLCCMLAF
jgi:hypothetical protein